MKWNAEIESKCQTILGNAPEGDLNFRTWTNMESRRSIAVKKILK